MSNQLKIKIYMFLTFCLILIVTIVGIETISRLYIEGLRLPEQISSKIYRNNLEKNENGHQYTSKYLIDPEHEEFPHPFLGSVHNINENHTFPVDDIKLEERYQLMAKGKIKNRKDNKFVIGIFGSMKSEKAIQQVLHDKKFKKEIEKQRMLKNQEIEFINLVSNNTKQPEQFLLFSHFSQLLDMAIIFSGDNEMSNSNYPSYPIEYPINSQILYPRNFNFQKHLLPITYLKKLDRLISEIPLKLPFLSQSYSYFYFWSLSRFFLTYLSQYINQQISNNNNYENKYFFSKNHLSYSREDILKIKFYLWAKYTYLTQLIAKEEGIPIIFFLDYNFSRKTLAKRKNDLSQKYDLGKIHFQIMKENKYLVSFIKNKILLSFK